MASVAPASAPRKKRKWLKLVLLTLAIVIAVPIACVSVFLGWCAWQDKTNGSLVSSGRTRTYQLYVPKSYDRSKPAPLVISMHGAAGWPALQMQMSRWNDVADRHGFLVAYPAGTNLFWDGRGPKVWPMGKRGTEEDVKFISDLIDKLEADYNVDPARIYVDGLSNGGGMTFAVSCRLSNRIAAVGAVSAAQLLPFTWCNDPTPVPMIAIHGTADPMVLYRGGRSGDPVNPVMFPSVPEWTANWARRNQCQGSPTDTVVAPGVHKLAYANCAAGADVALYTIDGGGHAWPGTPIVLPHWWVGRTPNEINGSEVLWDFYASHPKR